MKKEVINSKPFSPCYKQEAKEEGIDYEMGNCSDGKKINKKKTEIQQLPKRETQHGVSLFL